MKCAFTWMSCLAGIAAVGLLAAATTQEKKPDDKKHEEKKAEAPFVSADTAKFKEVAKGASMATIWGDPDKGAFRAFTKFEPGAEFALHTHSSAMRIVVIKGAYVYKPEHGAEKRVTAGCYLETPAGDRHASGGDPKEGALFYNESTGKFDLNFVEVKKP